MFTIEQTMGFLERNFGWVVLGVMVAGVSAASIAVALILHAINQCA